MTNKKQMHARGKSQIESKSNMNFEHKLLICFDSLIGFHVKTDFTDIPSFPWEFWSDPQQSILWIFRNISHFQKNQTEIKKCVRGYIMTWKWEARGIRKHCYP